MARAYERTVAKFVAQASAAITADADSGGTQTDYDKATTGNLNGCNEANVEIDVTVAPGTACSCSIYIEPEELDGAGYGAKKFVGSVQIETTAKKYNTRIQVSPEKGRILLHAVDFGFTASAEMQGVYISDTDA